MTALTAHNFPNMPLPTCISILHYQNGVYIGGSKNNEPHGFGFYSIPAQEGYSSIWYIGEFKHGQENGLGTIFYPEHDSLYTGLYSLGKVQYNVIVSSAELNTHLQKHLIHISNLLNNVKEDLDDERTATAQVDCSLTIWKTKFDIVCNLAQSSGVDTVTLNNIRSEHDSLTLYNKALNSNIVNSTAFANIKKEYENGN
jgi:hypothetical protein